MTSYHAKERIQNHDSAPPRWGDSPGDVVPRPGFAADRYIRKTSAKAPFSVPRYPVRAETATLDLRASIMLGVSIILNCVEKSTVLRKNPRFSTKLNRGFYQTYCA